MKHSYFTEGKKRRDYALRILLAIMLVPLLSANAFASPPTITQQPTNSTVCAGGTTSFTVAASGATGYQWEVNQGSGFVPVSGAVYSGATTATLTITGATASMNGYQYHCVVNGTPPPNPPQTRTTNDVTLTVNSPPAITSQPANRTVCEGSGTTFTAAASSATGYQWQVNQGSGFNNASGPPYSGVTTPTLTISATTASMNSYQYRMIASGTCSPNATSNAGTLTVISVSTTGSQTNVSCNGGTSGSATVAPSGGVTPYTYSWAPSGGTNSTATGLSAGNYTVTVTDATGCTATRTYTITQPPAITSTGSQTNVSCNGGSNGSATVTPSGGTPGYTYSWAPSGGTDSTATGLSAGNYTVTITDANSCTATRTYTITEPDTLTASGSQINVSCNGGSDGSATVIPSGGTSPYSYLWDPAGGADSTATGLAAGGYTVTVTDANGCTVRNSYDITEPDSLLLSSVITNVGCNGDSTGAVDITVSGGTFPYTYTWSNGETTEDVSGLPVGSYTVTVSDSHACSVSATTTVTEPPAIALSGTVTDAGCNGDSTGAIDITVSGGTTPYSFSWSNGATSEDVSGLAAGSYTVTVHDDYQCSVTDTFIVNEPAVLVSSSIATNVGCNGDSTGMIDLTVSGGTMPYSFIWSNGDTTEDINTLTAGAYNVLITDNHSCTSSATITITEPGALGLSSVITNAGCNGDSTGAIDITVTGGTTPYSFSWNNGETTEDISGLPAGSYNITVTDSNSCMISDTLIVTEPAGLGLTSSVTNAGCNGDSTGAIDITVTGGTVPYSFTWSNGETTEDISGLPAGTYTITVYDAHQCSITSTISVTEPAALGLTSSIANVGCNNNSTGAIDITVNGGTTPYTFSWSNSATSEDVSGLAAGSYNVTVTDSNSCVISGTFTITEPGALNLTSEIQNVRCHGDSTGYIALTVSGGTTPYTYAWSNGDTTVEIFDLPAGTYMVSVSDSNGCSVVDTFDITEPALFTLSTTLNNVGCNGDSTGSIDNTLSGGTPPVTFSWNTGDTSEDLIGVPAGTYSVIIIDSNSCTIMDTVTITEPNALMVTAAITNAGCSGDSTGVINITVTGGTMPYSYSWSNGETTEDISGLTPGSYTVTVHDDHQCSITSTFTVTGSSALAILSSVTNIGCADSTGAIDITVTGGTMPYLFNWSNGATTEDVSNLPAGGYAVTVTDSSLCSIVDTFTVDGYTPMAINVIVSGISCVDTMAVIDVTVTGGVGGLTFTWNNGSTSEDLTNIGPGTYVINVTDTNGCSIGDTVVVIGDPVLSSVVTFDMPMDTICYRTSVLTLTATPEGGIFTGSGVQGNTFDPNTSFGEHVITYTYIDSSACGVDTVVVTDTVWVVLCNGIDQVAFDNPVHIVPNPANGQFMLSLEGLGEKDATVRIMDAGGKQVFTESLPVSNGAVSRIYDTSVYSKGLYLVQVISGDRVFNERLIVQ